MINDLYIQSAGSTQVSKNFQFLKTLLFLSKIYFQNRCENGTLFLPAHKSIAILAS